MVRSNRFHLQTIWKKNDGYHQQKALLRVHWTVYFLLFFFVFKIVLTAIPPYLSLYELYWDEALSFGFFLLAFQPKLTVLIFHNGGFSSQSRVFQDQKPSKSGSWRFAICYDQCASVYHINIIFPSYRKQNLLSFHMICSNAIINNEKLTKMHHFGAIYGSFRTYPKAAHLAAEGYCSVHPWKSKWRFLKIYGL